MRIGCLRVFDELQGDFPVEPAILGDKHLAQSAARERPKHLERLAARGNPVVDQGVVGSVVRFDVDMRRVPWPGRSLAAAACSRRRCITTGNGRLVGRAVPAGALEHIAQRLEIVTAGKDLEARRGISSGHRHVVLDGRIDKRAAGHIELLAFDEQSSQRMLAAWGPIGQGAGDLSQRNQLQPDGDEAEKNLTVNVAQAVRTCLRNENIEANDLNRVFKHPLSLQSRLHSSRTNCNFAPGVG